MFSGVVLSGKTERECHPHAHTLSVNSPYNYLLYTHMSFIGLYSDFVLGIWEDNVRLMSRPVD